MADDRKKDQMPSDAGAPVAVRGGEIHIFGGGRYTEETPRTYTHEEAEEIAEGVKEAAVLNPHKGEKGGPEPKHHVDHF